MDDHSSHDDHGVVLEDDSVVASEPGGLGRRHLLGGLVAGAAGLLLPHPAAARNLDVRLTIVNHLWPTVSLSFWIGVNGGRKNIKLYDNTLVPEGVLSHWPPQHLEPSIGLFQINGTYNVKCVNPWVGSPFVKFSKGSNPDTAEQVLKEDLRQGQRAHWYLPENGRVIAVSRLADSAHFKEFLIELSIPGQLATKKTDDKKDKKDHNNRSKKHITKRRRKRRGGGGISSRTNRRTRPVDRLLR